MKLSSWLISKLIVAAMVLAFIPSIARADQAYYVTKAQADKAVVLLMNVKKQNKRVRKYCSPCASKGDKIYNINTVEAKSEGGSWAVYVNGVGVDLAYLYFESANHGKNWKNVAIHIGMKVDADSHL